MISCVADGEPLPDISWRRASDGQTFVDGDKVGGSGRNTRPLLESYVNLKAGCGLEYFSRCAEAAV